VSQLAPPVDWPQVGRVRERLGLPVVANGDIWTVADFRRCRNETGCRHFMLGRGALADPRLAPRVAAELGLAASAPADHGPVDWAAELRRLARWADAVPGYRPDRTLKRLKQWLRYAADHGGYGGFDAVRRAATMEELFSALGSSDRDDRRGGVGHAPEAEWYTGDCRGRQR
jgi:tRNA-dihydrouridine synthase C